MTNQENLTFEQVDELIRKADLSEYQNADLAAADIATQLRRVCGVYRTVRPILNLVVNVPLIPSSWKNAIRTFVSVLNSICV